MNKLGFYIIYILLKATSFLPFFILHLISDFLYFLIFHVLKYRRKVVTENLINSFPEKNITEKSENEKGFYRHLCDLIIENIKLLNISPKEIEKRCKIKNPELLNKYYDEGKSIIAVVGHYCNWEWGIMLPIVCKHKVLAIYKPISDKNFNEFYKNMRSRFGVEPISMKETFKRMFYYDRNNQPILTVFIGDQTPHIGEIQYSMPFLNQNTPVFIGTERIAEKLNHVVVFLKMQKVKRSYYEVDAVLLNENPTQMKEYALTNQHVNFLEDIIKEKPDYWLWSHRRWKYAKKAFKT